MYPPQHPNSAVNDMAASAAQPEWSWPENKIFEDALVEFPPELPNRWQRIAGCLPGRSPHDVMHHYQTLMLDVTAIDAGHVHLPNYPDDLPESRRSPPPPPTSADRKSQCDRKKGRPWTVEEHLLFLKGLAVYGKSDWRSISRNMVTTRLPSQVASHAQKFFNRLKSKKSRKRSSIHDITSISDCFFAAADMDDQLPYLNHGTNNSAAGDMDNQLPYLNHGTNNSTAGDMDQLPYLNYGTDNSAAASVEPQPLSSVPIKEEERLRSFDGNGGGGAAPMGGVQETETDAAFMYQQFPSEFGYGYGGLGQYQHM